MDNMNEIEFNNPDEIQICNSVSEVNNKIEHFLKRKREESDDNITRRSKHNSNYFTSSRTHTTIVAKCRKKTECFAKNSKITNPLGPSCSGGLNSASDKRYQLLNNTGSVGIKPDIQERISNLETCLNIKNNDHNNYNIYEKLKSIEDHVLKLENKLMNNAEYYSLSQIVLNDGNTEITNHNIKTNYCSQEQLCIEDNKSNGVLKLKKSKRLPTNSKYTAEEILTLINKIKGIDEN